MSINSRKRLIELYADLAAHTEGECSQRCERPRSCCEERYCLMAIDFAATLSEIAKTGYDGWLTVELYPYLDDPDAAAREAKQFLTEKLAGK